MTVKVFNVYDYLGSTELFEGHGWSITDKLSDADIVCLNGGEDIATEIYGQTPVFRGVPEHTSKRDLYEIQVYNEAKEFGKFVLGICRGAQLINCLNGGTLWQHVNNHGTGHTMFDLRTEEGIYTTSVHHQMMIPGPNAEIIAVASQAGLKISPEGTTFIKDVHQRSTRNGDDPEVVWYEKTRSLCIQGHPEFAVNSSFASYCFRLTESLRIDNMWPEKTITA